MSKIKQLESWRVGGTNPCQGLEHACCPRGGEGEWTRQSTNAKCYLVPPPWVGKNSFYSPFLREMAREIVQALITGWSPWKCQPEQAPRRAQKQPWLHVASRAVTGRCQLCPRTEETACIRASWSVQGLSPADAGTSILSNQTLANEWKEADWCRGGVCHLGAFASSPSSCACLCCPFQCLE